ncbi:MAG TPA: glycosyltransferase family 1 protein, partial [Ktedonobacterales bacterium]|nr:glycosyltransferase family 1 protein [Ktedonobacterales bacterium]
PESMQVAPAVVNATLSSFGVQPYSYLLHVGVLERRKNLVTLVEAFALWRQRGGSRSFKLVLVGQPGPRPDLDDSAAIHEAIARNRLGSSVVLTGHLSIEERNAFYTHAAAVVIPSVLEGFGIPVLETFAAHVPLICSDATALPEVAGNAALLFNPQNAQELASCFARLGADPGLRAALVRAGDERLRLFTWKRTAQATYAAFEAAAMRAYGPAAALERPSTPQRPPMPHERPTVGWPGPAGHERASAGSLAMR